MIPRIRGYVGEAEEGPHIGKWYFKIFLCELGDLQDGDPIACVGPFETEELAQAELRKACKLAVETIEKNMTGDVSGNYIDMKAGGITRRWDKTDEQ